MSTSNDKSWNVDLTHSGVTFTVRHMVIAKVRGRFTKLDAKLELDDQDWTRSKVDVRIDVSSIDTGVGDRDAHLRSPDFFDAEKFPEIVFAGKRIEKLSDDRFRLVGDLTIHGATHEVPLEVDLGGVGKDPWGNTRAGFSARGHIDRRDFGLQWNKALETGGVLVGERVDIEIELEAVKAAATQAA